MTLSKSIFSINIQTNGPNVKLVSQLCNYNIKGCFTLMVLLGGKAPSILLLPLPQTEFIIIIIFVVIVVTFRG